MYPQVHCPSSATGEGHCVGRGAGLLSVTGERWPALGKAWGGQEQTLSWMDLRAVADGEPGTMSLEAAGVGGEAGLCCLLAHKSLLHGCGTGDELQMSRRVFQVLCEITTALRFSSETTSYWGFSEIQGILDVALRIEIGSH